MQTFASNQNALVSQYQSTEQLLGKARLGANGYWYIAVPSVIFVHAPRGSVYSSKPNR